MKKKIRVGLIAATVMVFVALVIQLISFSHYEAQQERRIIDTAQQRTDELKTEISSLLSEIKLASDKLGESFGDRDYTDEEIKELLREIALEYPAIQGVTACYEPYGFSADKRLYCPYYNKRNQSYIYIEDSYDYTVKGEGTAWYTGVVENGAKWVEPYYGAAAHDWYVDYGVPFYYIDGPKKGRVRGVIDFSLEVGDFAKIIHTLSVGRAGYGIITTQNGAFVSHPNKDYVGHKTISDVINDVETPELVAAYQAIQMGKTGKAEFFDAMHSEETIFIYDVIEASGYGLGMAFFKRDLQSPGKTKHRRYINIALTFSLLLVLGLTLYFGRDQLDHIEIEWISIIATALLLSNVVLIGTLEHKTVRIKKVGESPPIVDVAGLSNFVAAQSTRASRLKLKEPIAVPTGLFIERMEFADSYNLNIGGSLWQKYPLDVVDEVAIGFRFPQMSPFAEAAYIEESYREEVQNKEGEDGYLLVGWDYRVTLRLNLKYANFPFDKRHLDIQISPLSYQDHLLFVPDLASYDNTNPPQQPGLSSNIFMSGNEITQSYFNFTTEDINADFGFAQKLDFKNVPVLHFNIHMKRFLLNAFVTYLIPIAVALSLIYILVLSCTKTEARQGIIESMAAFFFVLIFSHIDLRKDIETADLIFMEFFYFITYFMIIISTVNLMIYTKRASSPFDYRENLIFRAVYFPISLILLLMVMIWKFY